MGIRFSIILGVIGFAYSSLLFNLYRVQVANGEYYFKRTEAHYAASTFIGARRGTIYFTDREGSTLAVAIDKEFPLIFAAPKDIGDPYEAAHAIAPLIGESVDELVKKFSKEGDSYELLQNKADIDVAKKIEDLKIDGIYTTGEPQRSYPFNSLASHILGFVGPDSESPRKVGRYGTERFYEALLTGIPGEIQNKKVVSARAGSDLTLTLDPNIQFEVERILENLVKKYRASGGGIIVEDPKNGKILAMAGSPDFNPNSYSESEIGHFLNPMTQEIYEPGSVFKVITMAAGIDAGKITKETSYLDTGSLTLNGRTIGNYDLKTKGPYGTVTMTNVIEHSINTGAVFAERKLGHELFTEYVREFGFGEKTGIDLPGELAGDIKRLSPKERDIAFATAAYGQGIAVTPIEVINAFSAIANGGSLMRPYINAAMEPEVIREVIRETTAREATSMMISAVDKADVAAIKGYTLAGKTGTAFIPDFKRGGYTERVINTYVGFGPTRDARFVVLIKLDDPEGAPVAALTVVPAFRDLAQFILNYYQIQPDRLHEVTSR